MTTSEVVLLLSGGIDSTTLLAELSSRGHNIHALSFDYGQKHRVELEFAKRNAAKYKVASHQIIRLDYSSIAAGNPLTDYELSGHDFTAQHIPEGISESYVPGRNLLMLSHAAAYAEAHGLIKIYLGANKDDGKRFPDCSAEFIQALNQLWQTCPNTKSIVVLTPYVQLTKAEVVRKSLELGVNLNETLSCYAPIGNLECGTCLSCILKKDAVLLSSHNSEFEL